jgi:membrane associated rhomboid family serine protease
MDRQTNVKMTNFGPGIWEISNQNGTTYYYFVAARALLEIHVPQLEDKIIRECCSHSYFGSHYSTYVLYSCYSHLAQIVYFIIEVSIGGVVSLAENPAAGPGQSTLIMLGAKDAFLIKYSYHIHRLFVPIIMHAGFFHLAMNMFVQFMIGLGYERNWKIYRMMPIYIISGIAGNLLSCVALPNTISVGASGAIMGMIGAKVANIVCRWYKIPPQHRIVQVISVAITIAIVMLWSFSSYIDWASHLGGLIVGALLGFAAFANEIENRVVRTLFIVVPLGLAIIYFITLSLVLGLVTAPTTG